MANKAMKKPIDYDYGDDFNYARWNEDTVLTLTHVNWNSDYRDVWYASTRATLDDYINSQDRLVLNNVSYARFNRNVRVNTPANKALNYNYLRAVNGNSPVGDSNVTYYYFIQDIIYIGPNTTELVLQLDVWQTFSRQVTFGNCYVQRGHIGMANTNQFDNYGRDYLSIPEGLDVGGEYRIVKTARETVMDLDGDDHYSVLVAATVDLTRNPGTIGKPKLYAAKGSIVDGLPSGASFYVFPTPTDFIKFMQETSEIPWITQNLISMTVIPNIRRYHPNATLTDVSANIIVGQADLPGGGGSITITLNDLVMYNYPSDKSSKRSNQLAPDWRDNFLNFLPARFRGLKKLLTFPYSMIELTTWTGQPLVIRPEAWQDDNATIVEQAIMLPPAQRVAFMPYRYNGDANTSSTADDDNAEHLDFATTMSNFPSIPIVNNMAIAFLANNKNSLAFQFNSAEYSQTKAMRGAQATYDVAGSEIGNTARQSGIANTAGINAANMAAATSMDNMMVGLEGGAIGMLGGVAGGAGALAMGQAGGLGAGSVQAGNNAMLQQNLAVNAAGARSSSAGSSIKTTAEIRDTNVALARFAAKGDYENQVAGINAKIQDARMTQPSVSGQFNGDAMNLAHSNAEVSARWKMIDNATLRRIGNYWLRYGYAVEQFVRMPSDFQCMSKFTYWKLSESYITVGTIPEQFKQALRGIFEKGVTVWANANDIGNIDIADNAPKGGISF